jgi:hypothetical protein
LELFLSYRREDSAGYAGRLSEHLSGVFGPQNVFMDVQDIAPGQDFAEAIEKTISACRAVVVVIGPRWAADLKQRGDGDDFVLHEVSIALRRNVRVIPVLVGGAKMPAAADLPTPIAPLSRRQALEIRDARFDDDVKLLTDALGQVPGLSDRRALRRRRMWAGILSAALLLVVAVSVVVWKQWPRFDVNGVWIADMQKPNRRPYRVRLDLVNSNGELTGTVVYPSGQGAVQSGTLKDGRLTFSTTHVPQFATAAATIRWSGTVEGDDIRFAASDDEGVARGIAHRRR